MANERLINTVAVCLIFVGDDSVYRITYDEK